MVRERRAEAAKPRVVDLHWRPVVRAADNSCQALFTRTASNFCTRRRVRDGDWKQRVGENTQWAVFHKPDVFAAGVYSAGNADNTD